MALMKFPTTGYQYHVKGLRGSVLSDSTRIISWNNLKMRGQLGFLGSKSSSVSLKQYSGSTVIPNRFLKRPYYLQCQCTQNSGLSLDATFVKNAALSLAWPFSNGQGKPDFFELAVAVGVTGLILLRFDQLMPLRWSMCQNECDNSLEKGSTYHVAISYIQRLFIWLGAVFLFGVLESVVPSTIAGKIVKRLVHYVRSVSTMLTFTLSASSLYWQIQKFEETDEAIDTRKLVILVALNFVYFSMRIVAALASMDFYGHLSFIGFGTRDLFKLTVITFLVEEIWKLCKDYAPALTSKDYASTLTSKDYVSTLSSKDYASTFTSNDYASALTSKGDVVVARNPSTAAEDAVRESLISLDGISEQLKDITRLASDNVVDGALNNSLLASLKGIREQISAVLEIDNPCGQNHIIEAQCAASSTFEEEY